MNLSQMTSGDLNRIARLLETREALEARVRSLEHQLAAFEPAAPDRARTVRPAPSRPLPVPLPAQPTKRRRAKRGAVAAAILRRAQQAGNAGVTVKELAAELGLSQNRVFNWFYATGKHVRELKKIGEAHYAWVGTAPAPALPLPAVPPVAPVPTARARKPAKSTASGTRAAKPGQLKDSVIELVKAAGKSGVTVREIAGELGVHPQRVYVWFNTTAKNVPEIQKLGPATYGWMD
jgi:transposase-like protein